MIPLETSCLVTFREKIKALHKFFWAQFFLSSIFVLTLEQYLLFNVFTGFLRIPKIHSTIKIQTHMQCKIFSESTEINGWIFFQKRFKEKWNIMLFLKFMAVNNTHTCNNPFTYTEVHRFIPKICSYLTFNNKNCVSFPFLVSTQHKVHLLFWIETYFCRSIH